MGWFDPNAAREVLDDRNPLMEPLEQRVLLSGADLTGTVAVSGLILPDSPSPGAEVRLTYQRNPDPEPGLESYTIKLIGTDPDYIVSGFGGRFDGPMSQVMDEVPWGSLSTPTLDQAGYLAPDELARDTHLLWHNGDLVFGTDYPHEDRDPNTGLGSWLAASETQDMAFAFRSDMMAHEITLAQVVVPAGEQVVVSGQAGYKWDDGGAWAYDDCPVSLVIPAADASFSADYTVHNAGDADAGAFWVDFYLSSDALPDAGDTLLGQVRINGLAAGADQSGSLDNLDLPDDDLDADWYVVMDIDAAGDVADPDTTNNHAADQILAETPTVDISDAQLVEGDAGTTEMTFTVSLSAPSSTTVSVDYATTNDTATAGDDYDGVAGTVVFGPGQTQTTLVVPVLGDTLVETDEIFFVDLDGPIGAALGDARGAGTITNDDIPTVSVDDVSVTEGDAGTVDVTFTVTLSGSHDQAVSVDYATADGSATAGEDYTAQSDTLNFAPGQTTRIVTVSVNGDEALEVDETFHLDLSSPVGAVLGDGRGTATILNDDGLVRGFDATHKVTFLDASGDLVTVSMKGPGLGRVVTSAANGFDPDSISLTGTTAKTKVTITTKGKGSFTTIRQIKADGRLGGFTGKTLDLLGDFTLRDVTGDYLIDIGAPDPGDVKTASTIVLGQVTGASLTSLTPIKSLTVTDWTGASPAGQITAPWIGKLTAKGNRKAGVAGDFLADLTLTDPPGTKPTLAAAKIAGSITGAAWEIAGDMGKLTVLGAVTDSRLRTEGSMAGVTVGASDGSDFLAGVDAAVNSPPDGIDDFVNVLAAIKSFKVKGIKGDTAPRWFFAGSNVSAATIGTVKLLNVDFDNGTDEFGVWARDAGTGKEIKSVKWADKIDKTKDAWTPKAGTVYALPDLTIEIFTA